MGRIRYDKDSYDKNTNCVCYCCKGTYDKWIYRDDYGINEDYPVQSIQPNLYFDDEKLNYLHSECEMVLPKNVGEKPQEICWECKNAITKLIRRVFLSRSGKKEGQTIPVGTFDDLEDDKAKTASEWRNIDENNN